MTPTWYKNFSPASVSTRNGHLWKNKSNEFPMICLINSIKIQAMTMKVSQYVILTPQLVCIFWQTTLLISLLSSLLFMKSETSHTTHLSLTNSLPTTHKQNSHAVLRNTASDDKHPTN